MTADNAASRELLRRYQVPGPPSLIWIGPEGEERRARRLTGEVDAGGFLAHGRRPGSAADAEFFPGAAGGLAATPAAVPRPRRRAARWLAGGARRRRNAEPVLFNLLLLGLLVARLAFVVRYWPQYRGDFAQMLDIRDGGFLAWPGLLAAVLGALFWPGGDRRRRSLGVGASLGLAFWLLGSLGLGIYERGTRLPD